MKVLFGAVLIDALHASLKDAEIAFERINKARPRSWCCAQGIAGRGYLLACSTISLTRAPLDAEGVLFNSRSIAIYSRLKLQILPDHYYLRFR